MRDPFMKNQEEEDFTLLEKLRNFLNNRDNGMLIRFLMAFVGIVIGATFLILAAMVESILMSVNLNILGWLIFGGFGITALAWHGKTGSRY